MLNRLLGVHLAIACSLLAATGDRIQLTLDTSEADQVLAILALRTQGQAVPDSEWQKLFATAPYQRLKQREGAMAQKQHDPTLAFSDDDFKRFVLSEDLLHNAPLLLTTLDRWKKAEIQSDAQRILGYLPAEATLRAKVYPVIKPRSNSFVWDLSTDPAIFLYLEPRLKPEKFRNNVAHELHHIGLGSVGPVYSQKIAALPAPAHAAAEWMGAFGEGMAMLAAAGGPGVHPHATSVAKERARWEHDMGEFDNDLPTVNQFFLDVLKGELSKDAVQAKGASFYGVQGPWYTVGYKMCAMVEQRFGRQALIDAMLDPRCLLVLYNKAAEQQAAGEPSLPLWSDEVLSGVQVGACVAP
jgi:hypothetical protein